MPPTCLVLMQSRHLALHPSKYPNSFNELVKCFRRHLQTSPNSKRERGSPPLRRLRHPSFIWHYTSNYEPPLHVQTYITDPYHVLHHKYKRKYERRSRDTLWWTAYTAVATSPKSVVRNYCSRKMRDAFINALQVRGYDRDGRIPASEDLPNDRIGILGSARFSCLKPMITIDPAALNAECLAIVDNIISLNKRAQKQKSVSARSASSAMPFRSNLLL